MMKYSKKIICICFLIEILNACSDTHNDDLIRYMKQIKHQKMRVLEQTPSFRSLALFEFPNTSQRRNPFQSKRLQEQEVLNPSLNKRLKESLEAFPLEALKFVGILRQGKTIRALIEAPNHEMCYVQVGHYMGQNYGRIVSISNDSIQLVEIKKHYGIWKRHMLHWKLGYAPQKTWNNENDSK